MFIWVPICKVCINNLEIHNLQQSGNVLIYMYLLFFFFLQFFPLINFFELKASKQERLKQGPTLKDLDFMEENPEGIFLEKDTWDALIKTLQRDCRVRC